MCNVSKARIARRVLEYLAEREDAQDTLEGVVEWWLVKQQLVEQTATVRDVLDELVAEGLLVSQADSSARTLYGLNRGRVGDISTYLKTHPD
jgi:Fe2+ or Zn2+ uptake regulation protein